MLMLGMLKVKTRLRTTKMPTWEASSSRPRWRAIRKAPAIRPKIPPEAPTVSWSGSSSSAPQDPARIAAT